MRMRSVAATAMNHESSRSHLLLIIRIESQSKETKQRSQGKILICDLAGSERLKKSESEGTRKREAIEINKSLTALGDVIEALTKGRDSIPYRNHALTMILRDALGGSAKALMFVNCSPSNFNCDETLMSLKYATRAKKITNTYNAQAAPEESAAPPKSTASANAATTPRKGAGKGAGKGGDRPNSVPPKSAVTRSATTPRAGAAARSQTPTPRRRKT